jgi:hypothetical protein
LHFQENLFIKEESSVVFVMKKSAREFIYNDAKVKESRELATIPLSEYTKVGMSAKRSLRFILDILPT